MPKNENDLGFGHFSTAATEHDWFTRSYDGMEGDGSDNPVIKALLSLGPEELKDLEKIVWRPANLRSFS